MKSRSPTTAADAASNKYQEALRRMVSVVRCTHIKRALHKAAPNHKLNFWRVIQGAMLDLAVIDWCVVFGSEREPAHWKKLIPSEQHEQFRSDLLKITRCNEEEWKSYRNGMKRYRDKHVAHLGERDSSDAYPKLDIALTSCELLYTWLKKAKTISTHEDDLKAYGDRFLQQSVEIAGKAIKATHKIKEKVN